MATEVKEIEVSAADAVRLQKILSEKMRVAAAAERPPAPSLPRQTPNVLEADVQDVADNGSGAKLMNIRVIDQGAILPAVTPSTDDDESFAVGMRAYVKVNNQTFPVSFTHGSGDFGSSVVAPHVQPTSRSVKLVEGIDYIGLAERYTKPGGDLATSEIRITAAKPEEAAPIDRLFGTKAYKTAGYSEEFV